jgi:hypothetical protein
MPIPSYFPGNVETPTEFLHHEEPTPNNYKTQDTQTMTKGTLSMIAAAAFAVLGGTYLLLSPNADGEGKKEKETATTDHQPTRWTGPLPKEVAEKFTQAGTTAERLKWVRDPTRMAPIVEAFYGEGGLGNREEVVDLKPMKALNTPDVSYQRFQVKLKGGSSRLLAVIPGADGAKVDFECYARHGSASWPNLLAGKATEAEVVRLTIKPTVHYKHTFSDEDIWRAFMANSPDLADPIYLYARRGSKEEKRLINFKSQRPVRATLAIRSIKDSHQQRQFEATAIHGRGWVVVQPGGSPES